MRLLMAAIVRKFGTLDVITLSPVEVQAVQQGDIRIIDDPTGLIKIGMRIKGQAPHMGPKIISRLN